MNENGVRVMDSEENFVQNRYRKIFEKEHFFLKMHEAIEGLPESQRQFYKDYFEAGRTQADVAKMYNISPQAITNRLKKLTKTVRRIMEEDYGYTEEDIMSFINAGSMFQILNGDV